MSNKEKYNDVFKRVFLVDDSQLGDGFEFGKVKEWDSVAHMKLISELEDEFDVMFDTDDILHYGSYDNGIRILSKMGIEM